MAINKGHEVTVAADAAHATGCVPEGHPHVHAGTCGEIIATAPFPRRAQHAGQTGIVQFIDEDNIVDVVFADGEVETFAEEVLTRRTA